MLQSLRLRHVIEPHKGYSRDVESRWYNLGRVLVDKKQKGVIPLDERRVFHNKMDILLEIAKGIPHCPARRRRLEQDKLEKLNASAMIISMHQYPMEQVIWQHLHHFQPLPIRRSKEGRS